MSTTVISNNAPFGAMTNQSVARLIAMQATLDRLAGAIATASSGFTGTAGTQFEQASGLGQVNLFGVQPSETPGEQGSAYSFAVNRLHEEWQTFWTAAQPFIAQLDNGNPGGI